MELIYALNQLLIVQSNTQEIIKEIFSLRKYKDCWNLGELGDQVTDYLENQRGWWC